MIPLPAGCRVWIATGHTDMRRGMQGLALQVQEQLKCKRCSGRTCFERAGGTIMGAIGAPTHVDFRA